MNSYQNQVISMVFLDALLKCSELNFLLNVLFNAACDFNYDLRMSISSSSRTHKTQQEINLKTHTTMWNLQCTIKHILESLKQQPDAMQKQLKGYYDFEKLQTLMMFSLMTAS